MSMLQVMDQRTVVFECDVSVVGSSQPHVVLKAVSEMDKGAMLRLTADEALSLAGAMTREAEAITVREHLEDLYELPSAEETR